VWGSINAWQHVQAGGVEDILARGFQVGADQLDALAPDQDVGPRLPRLRDDGAAPDQHGDYSSSSNTDVLGAVVQDAAT